MNVQQTTDSQTGLRGLDVLRGVLATIVLVGHARGMLWMAWHDWKQLPHSTLSWMLGIGGGVFRYGHEAVLVFFCLSGFFIHLGFAQRQSKVGSPIEFGIGSYAQRRALRILPTYFAALVFTVLIDIVGRTFFNDLYSARTGDALIDENLSHAGYTASSVIPALLVQPSSLGIHFGSNGPLWSIACEVFYYAAYPIFVWIWLRNRTLSYLLAVLTGVSCWWIAWAGPWTGTVSYYPAWILGALLADLFISKGNRIQANGYRVIALATSLLCFALVHVTFSSPLNNTVRILLGLSTTLLFLTLPSWLLRFRVTEIFEWLGVRSYSIYVFHMPVITLIAAVSFAMGVGRPAHGWFCLLGIVAGFAAGVLGFELVEKRFLRRRINQQCETASAVS